MSMKTFKLENLTKELVKKHFENNSGMELETKSGTRYHIIKTKKGYRCFSDYCWNERSLTKAMKAVFC